MYQGHMKRMATWVCATALLVACGGSAPAAEVPTAGLAGDVLIDGSSTVFPITAAAAEEFSMMNPDVRASVGVSGTGGGFKKFCAGETDISNASRPIKQSEIDSCAKNGVEFIELPVAYDGLSVIVSPSNDFVQCLTIAELQTIWAPESQGTVTNWNQVRSDFPDHAMVLLGAGTDSGTFEYFTESVNGEAGASRGDYLATEDDNVTITGVGGDTYALGYLGYAYVIENQDKVKPVAIDGGNGCVDPSFESIADGSYAPFSRPLFIYVNAKSAVRPEVQAFVEYYLSADFTPLIQTPQVGYVALSDELYAAIANRFATGVTGTLHQEGQKLTLDQYLK
jgi:phosphate transport system substrate-binding protein